MNTVPLKKPARFSVIWLVAPTIGFAASFLIAAAWPSRALYAMAGGNVIFAANAVLRHPILRWWRARAAAR